MSVSISGDGALTGIDQGFNVVGVLTASSGIVVSAGTTSAPSISPSGDSNTGIFFPSPDTIAFAEGGVEAARIDSSSRVGVGTNIASAVLDVESNSPSEYIAEFRQKNTSNSGQIIIDSPTNGTSRPVLIDLARAGTIQWSIGQGYLASNDRLIFATSSLKDGTAGEQLAISTSGNIILKSGAGIDFSATSNSSGTMTSELLSDYEEGTWTPIAAANSGTITSYTSSGRYTKIGRQVVVKFTISISNQGTASGSYLIFSGLPFLASNTWTNIGVCREQNVNGFLSTAQINANATNGSILRYDNSGVIVNGTFQCTICYDVD
jgi:hypothetical protein